MYYKGKNINSYLYTKGKFSKVFRVVESTQDTFLYSKGIYKTKITESDLPESYIKIKSRSIWYMIGYLRTSGITCMKYVWTKENHLFKDDYIYISYHGDLRCVTNRYGFTDIEDYDVCVCGNDIVDIVLAAEKYSSVDTSVVRSEIEKKRIWLRDNEPEYYSDAHLEDRNIFDQWIDKGYVDQKLL